MGDYWLRHFEAYLQMQRLLSDLFTVVAIVGLIASSAALLFSSRPRRLTVIAACTTLAVLATVGGAYALVASQFRHSVLQSNDGLATAIPTFPGSTPDGTATWPDYRSGDAPPRAALSFTRLVPRAWNYASGSYFRPPAGTTPLALKRYLAASLSDWRKVIDADGTLVYERGKATVQVDVWKNDGAVERFDLIVNAWRPPDRAAAVAANASPAASPSSLLDPQGNVVLFVTNQSIALSPVDIAIRVDGHEVVDKLFRVGWQHTFERFVLRLSPGRHVLTAQSARGRASVTRSFVVAGKRWVAVSYWYYTKQQGTPLPRQLNVRVQDRPMLWD